MSDLAVMMALEEELLYEDVEESCDGCTIVDDDYDFDEYS